MFTIINDNANYTIIGSNLTTIPYAELPKHLKGWLKKSYPSCKFSFKSHKEKRGSKWTFYIGLNEADFNLFVSPEVTGANYNQYHHFCYEETTPECAKVMREVVDYVMSFYYEESTSADYNRSNFDVYFTVGTF